MATTSPKKTFLNFRGFFHKLAEGNNPLIVAATYLLLTTLWVYFDNQNLLAWLLFLVNGFLIYYLPIRGKFKVIFAVVMLLIIMPILGLKNVFYLEVMFQVCLFGSLALGLNILVGFTGLLNLGYVAFFAVGAYTWAFFGSQQIFMLHSIPGTQPITNAFMMPANWFYLFAFLGLGVAALVGFLLGLPVLRVRGDYLAIVTLGFGEVIRNLANNLDKPLNLTNGPQGIISIQRPTIPTFVVNGLDSVFGWVVRPYHIGMDQIYSLFFYLLTLLVVLLVVFVVMRLDNSRIGRAWTAIREDEVAAVANGIPLVKMKLAAFAVSASFAGIMGVIFAANRTFVSPESFNFLQSIGVLTMVILGGMGSIPGVLLGAAAVTVLNVQLLQGLSLALNDLRQSGSVIPIINFHWSDLSSQLDPAKYQRLLFGLILIIMMIYRSKGLIPEARRKRMPTVTATVEEYQREAVATTTEPQSEIKPTTEESHDAAGN